MKKFIILTVFMLGVLLVIPYGTFSVAQSNNYIGVSAGNEYEWRIELDLDGVDNVMDNVEGLMTEIQTRISDLELFGFESMTVPEAMENLSHTMLANILPYGWESMNLSELFHETVDYYVEGFNSTFLSGKIPSNWKLLNYSEFINTVVEGLNDTLDPGWEDQPIPLLIELALNEFNSSILFGLLPEGWETMTLESFFITIIEESFPEATESFLTYLMMDQLFGTLFMKLPPGADGEIISDLIPYMLPPEALDMNMTYILDGLWNALNNTSSPGWDSTNITSIIDHQADWININLTSMDSGLDGANITSIIKWGLNELIYNATLNPPPPFPLGWENMTIPDFINSIIEQGKTQFTTKVLPGWDNMMDTLDTLGATIPTTYGIKIAVDHIGTEVESTLGGQKGTPIDMTLFISIDMETWTSFEELIANLTNPSPSTASPYPPPEGDFEVNPIMPLEFLLNMTMEGYIVDPSTYSDPKIALLDQAVLTKGLIVATNYNWSIITTEATISADGNADAFEVSAEWNENGVLSQAYLNSDGVTAITITLVAGEEIPGYEIAILIIVFPLTVVGIIYYIQKKNK
ncbi:MAG: hypothetical protein HWN81_13340 [Candidatus Lokiarchaeota archaeon]|nr:hypothetical protein [Candidatus Lokiarchaeota archaeon]